MELEILSLSLRISCRFFVPKMVRRVVWASSLKKSKLSYKNTVKGYQLERI